MWLADSVKSHYFKRDSALTQRVLISIGKENTQALEWVRYHRTLASCLDLFVAETDAENSHSGTTA